MAISGNDRYRTKNHPTLIADSFTRIPSHASILFTSPTRTYLFRNKRVPSLLWLQLHHHRFSSFGCLPPFKLFPYHIVARRLGPNTGRCCRYCVHLTNISDRCNNNNRCGYGSYRITY